MGDLWHWLSHIIRNYLTPVWSWQSLSLNKQQPITCLKDAEFLNFSALEEDFAQLAMKIDTSKASDSSCYVHHLLDLHGRNFRDLIYLEEETPYAWSRHMNRFNMSFNMWFNSKAHFVPQIQYVIFCRQGKLAPRTVPFICSWHIGALARAGGLCRKRVIRPAFFDQPWLVDIGGYWWHVSAIWIIWCEHFHP